MNIQKIGERTGITLHRCTAPMRMRFHSFIFHRDTIAADQPRGRVRRLLAMVIFYYENYTSNRTKRFLLFSPLPRFSLSSYLFFFSLFFFPSIPLLASYAVDVTPSIDIFNGITRPSQRLFSLAVAAVQHPTLSRRLIVARSASELIIRSL